jgi:ABC-2 type transport system permease protein
MNNLNQALSSDFYTVDTINIVADPTIPEDCEILVIMGLASDLTEQEALNICSYIENGGDIIITGEINRQNAIDFPNFQKVLDEYYVKLPNKAVVETGDRMVSGYTNIFQTTISSDNEITRVLFNYTASTGDNITPLFIDAGIVDVDYSSIYSNTIKATPFVSTSNNASLSNLPDGTIEESTGENYALGVSFIKTVESGDESRAVIYSTTRSFSDYSIDGGNTPMFAYNGNLIVNSFAFASNRGELYSIRKSQSFIPYTATEKEDRAVRLLISAIPSAIGVLGICVWVNRRRLK